MTEDISKLPRWAKHRIQKLEADVTLWEKRAGIVEGDKSRVYWTDYSRVVNLIEDGSVAFQVGKDRQGIVTARLDRGTLYLNGVEPFLVAPESSNAVRIIPTRWSDLELEA